MFGMSWAELFLILIVALLVIGPEKLPEVARAAARLLRSAQRMAAEFQHAIQLEESSSYTAPSPTLPPQPKSEEPPLVPTTATEACSHSAPSEFVGPASPPASGETMGASSAVVAPMVHNGEQNKPKAS